ncbi:transposase [Mesorhizobium sp. LNJC391B00]|nr:transposase [Mesorhizobium sp. LNJC391B00]
MDVDWQADLEHWLQPFSAGLSQRTRRPMCPLCIAGLIGPGDRKSAQPMAARAGNVGCDQLHHFVENDPERMMRARVPKDRQL